VANRSILKMTQASQQRLELAKRLVGGYASLPSTRGILLTGSVAEGCADEFSDLDIIVYCDVLPSEETLDAAMRANGANERKWILGDRDEGELMEAYVIDGVECQFAHTTIDSWDRQINTVHRDLDVKNPIQKALSGVLLGIPMSGDPLIAEYKAKAADYPEALARKMVEVHLQSIVPFWVIEDRLAQRDTLLWRTEMVVQAVQNLLGVLAGLNRLYYTTFQFKRMGLFIEQMAIKPPDLQTRIDGLLRDVDNASGPLRQLVSRTVDLVEQHMPEVDTSAVRAHLEP
jgi:hypothetical protein